MKLGVLLILGPDDIQFGIGVIGSMVDLHSIVSRLITLGAERQAKDYF